MPTHAQTFFWASQLFNIGIVIPPPPQINTLELKDII